MFNMYPYTDFHEINLDWIIRKIKELGQAFNDFEAVNKITNAGAWDITKQYQAWTIVSDHNKGYISLKPVPVGVDINNIEYWGLVADYDILITDLSARISALENKVYKKYIFIGDSYGESPDSVTNWQTIARNTLNLVDNVNCFRIAQGGQGFSVNNVNGFLNLLNSIAATITDKESITDVVVAGGANDVGGFTTLTNLINGIADFVTTAKTLFPNALVSIAYIGYYQYNNPILTPVFDKTNYFNTEYFYEYSALTAGAAFLSGCEKIMHLREYMGTDGLHPNAGGAGALGRGIANALLRNTGTPSCRCESLLLTPVSGCTINGQTTQVNIGSSIITPENITLDINSLVWLPDSAVTTSNDFIKIADITGNTYANDPVDFAVMGRSLITDVSADFDAYPFILRFHQGSVYIKSLCYAGGTVAHTLLSFSIESTTLSYDFMKN